MGNTNFAVTTGLFEGGLAVLAVSLGWALGRPPMESFHFSAIDLGCGIIATVPLLAVLWISAKVPWRPFARIMQVLDETFIPLFRQCRMLELAVIALVAGLGEEMLFRGIVQSWVADKVGGRMAWESAWPWRRRSSGCCTVSLPPMRCWPHA